MPKISPKDMEEILKKMREKAKIEWDRLIARWDKELKDPEKGPILREELRLLRRWLNQRRSETALTEGVTGRQSRPATDTRHQRTRRWTHMRSRVEVTITLPKYLLQAIDGFAEIIERTRSAVIEAFAEYCLDHEDVIDKLFSV